jgi:hypothetical protein
MNGKESIPPADRQGAHDSGSGAANPEGATRQNQQQTRRSKKLSTVRVLRIKPHANPAIGANVEQDERKSIGQVQILLSGSHAERTVVTVAHAIERFQNQDKPGDFNQLMRLFRIKLNFIRLGMECGKALVLGADGRQ